jgi:hypothetical protein
MAQEVRSYPDLHDRLFRHERAHCNGWVHARPAEALAYAVDGQLFVTSYGHAEGEQ